MHGSAVRVRRYEMEHASWEVARRAPMPALRPYLSAVPEGWAHSRGPRPSLREVPFPGIPVIFNLGPAWEIEQPVEPGVKRVDSFLAGLHTAPAFVRAADASWACIELQLTPLGVHRLVGLPMSELANRSVGLEELLPDARVLSARLRDAPSWENRFDLVEEFLLRRLAEAAPPSPGVEWSWRLLRQTNGRVAIGALASELGWSHRRLIARFREQIGLAPKTVARVMRFDRAVAALRSGSQGGLAELAFECGYFDQAHLNREFRELAGTTPAAFAASTLASGGAAV